MRLKSIALWRPWHQARLLLGEQPKFIFKCDGCVWQRTGEDWENIDSIFSTARPSLSDPPLLTDDELSLQEIEKKIIVETRDRTGEKPLVIWHYILMLAIQKAGHT